MSEFQIEPLSIHQSYWLRRHPLRKNYPTLQGPQRTEVLVIGGGITGLSIALDLLQRGHNAIVCEANVIGAGTTGGSSGHLDAHPEMGPQRLVAQLGEDNARVYTEMRLAAIRSIEQLANNRCAFAHVPAYYYTENEGHLRSLRRDSDDASRIGLEVTWVDDLPIARGVGGYRIDGMARIDCLAYVQQLASLVVEHGGQIFEHTLVSGPTEKHPKSLATSHGEISFDQVIVAVHCNFTHVQRLYLQTPAYQSYVIAAEVHSPLPDALFWDDSEPYYYVRRGTVDGRVVLVGGRDHRTGDGDERAAMNQLEAWARERFDVKEIITRWSAELFEPTDGLPFIGKLTETENVWIATGLSGVGLTLGTAAGSMIADLVDGKPHPLESVLSPSRAKLSSVLHVVSEQTSAVKSYAQRVLPAEPVDVDQLEPGEGAIGTIDGKHVAVCRDDSGKLHQRSPICTHMGGTLSWNPVEKTWDCPVHGGRFAANGTRIYGPPESDLDDAT